MKKLLILITLFITFNGIAQNLENKIPNNAQVIFGVKGDNLLKLMPLNELNNFSFIKELLKKEKLNNIEDLGFSLNQDAYFFNQLIDGRYYNTFIVYLSDSKKLETLLDKKEKTETINGFNFITKNKFGAAWNSDMFIFTIISDANKVTEEVIESKPEVIEERIDTKNIKEEDDDVEIEFGGFVEDDGTNKNIVKDSTKIKNNQKLISFLNNIEIVKRLLKKQIISIINTNSNNSIAKNSSYKSSKKSKASANLWIKDYSASMMDLLKNYPVKGIVSSSLLPKNIIGITTVSSNLYFNDDNIKLSAKFSMTKEMKKRSKKMYRSKLDCSFFKYFNQNDVLAYMGYSVNMKAALDEYPKMINDIYGATTPKYKEEISAVADLVSVFLDEKAISKLITGDALFILNDIKEQEVSYTTYEYDDDYNRKEVVKTKQETLPIFTVMLGSENKELVEKLARLGLKYEVAQENNRIFKFDKSKSKSPYDLYFVMQDDIAFVTNSEAQINKISQKKVKRNLGKHKRLLRKNLISFYINSDKLIERLPSDKLGNKKKETIALIKEDFKEMQFSYKMKHGKFYVEQIVKTNDKNDNSLKTLFNLIEQISKL